MADKRVTVTLSVAVSENLLDWIGDRDPEEYVDAAMDLFIQRERLATLVEDIMKRVDDE